MSSMKHASSPAGANQQPDKEPTTQLRTALPGYVDSYYTATLTEPIALAQPLREVVDTETCVVGGGLAGLATALGLAERGRAVTVLERGRVACEASGMNGGFVIPGYALEGEEYIDLVGEQKAGLLYRWTQDALQLIKRRVEQYAIKCDLTHCGMLTLSCYNTPDAEAEEDVAYHNQVLGTKFEFWPAAKVRQTYKSDTYFHGVLDPDVHTVQPLNYTLGIARAARSKGATIYEQTAAVRVEECGSGNKRRWRVYTESAAGLGAVEADNVVLAGGSSLGGINKRVSRALVPIQTYIMVTEPLGAKLASAFTLPHAVVDDRFALNYYRPLPDGRLLWGGFATMRPIPPAQLKERMLADMLSVYPQLAGVRADVAWGGPVTFGLHFMPMLGQLKPGLWHCTGFGGHGLVPTTLAGELVASAIAEKDDRWTLFTQLFPLRYVGWPATQVLGALALTAYRLQDWLELTRQRLGW